MKHPKEYFRAGAGGVITDGAGRVLVFERSDVPNQWQMPQGRLKKNEERLHAALREIKEETGIVPSRMRVVGHYPTPLIYELPIDLRTRKTGRGQVQYWFLFELADANYELRSAKSKEF